MVRKMVVNAADSEEVRIAALDDGRLEEFDIETRGAEKNKGNIYKAKVIAVEPSLNAAFVDYGAEKQGFLTAGDVDPSLAPKPIEDKNPTIDQLLKPNQAILVQITKDEVDKKGAVLTTYLSVAGRYLVLMPESKNQGISRKIADEDERKAMRDAVDNLDVPKGMGIILRTAGRDRTKTELQRDLKVLVGLWDNIKKEAARAKAPALIFKEQDVIIRALRDYFTPDVDEMILDCDEAFDRASEYMHMVMPKHHSVLTRYVERRPIFHHYRIEEQLEALFSPRVPLSSGGSIVIEQAEALVAIDVNSGKQKAGGHEETALETNLEAAKEIARQLRLRDLGGIVVIDFIDMSQRKNQARVEKAMRAALRTDKARVKVGRISRNGTLELTRQRIRSALAKSVFRTCSVCHGTGRILNPGSHAVSVLRRLADRAARGDLASARIRIEPEAANVLRTVKWSAIQDLEQRYAMTIDIVPEHSMSPGSADFTFNTNPDASPIELAEPNFGPVELPEEIRAELEAERKAAEAEEAAELKEMEEQEEARRAVKKKRRRRKKKPATGGDADAASLSFELIDPSELGLRNKKSDKKDGEDEKKTRSRRGGRRRRKGPRPTAEPRPQATRESTPRAPTPAVAVAEGQQKKKKKGLFGWLFGG